MGTIILWAVGVIYLLSLIGAYHFMMNAFYNPKGMWYGLKMDELDIFSMFLPVLNTYISLMFIYKQWKE